MTTYTHSQMLTTGGLAAAFNPATDVLLFQGLDVSQVEVLFGLGTVTFVLAGGSFTLNMSKSQIAGGQNIVFTYGMLAVGDNLVTSGGDDLANVWAPAASAVNGTLRYHGLGGDDSVVGVGTDLIYGNQGNDTILGNGGTDILYGGQGNDSIIAGMSGTNALIYGNAGSDLIKGTDGSASNSDVIYGGQGIDTIDGLGGNDTIYGNKGDDDIATGGSYAVVYGGQGNDDLSVGYASSQALSTRQALWDVFYPTDYYTGYDSGTIADLITGSSGDTSGTTNTNTTTDTTTTKTPLQVHAGALIYGNLDNDIISIKSSAGGTAFGGQGDDTLLGSGDVGSGDYYLYGNRGNDSIVGGRGNDILHGGPGSDFIRASGGVDDIYGGSGADIFAWYDSTDFEAYANGNQDHIHDYSANVDRIKMDLRGILGSNPTTTLYVYTGRTDGTGHVSLLKINYISNTPTPQTFNLPIVGTGAGLVRDFNALKTIFNIRTFYALTISDASTPMVKIKKFIQSDIALQAVTGGGATYMISNPTVDQVQTLYGISLTVIGGTGTIENRVDIILI